jgi:hypothetical protein
MHVALGSASMGTKGERAVPTNLSTAHGNEVDSVGFLDVRLDGSTTHYLIFTGIALPEFQADDDHGGGADDPQREDVTIDLGVDVTKILGYTATVGLASVENDDSSFTFATDEVRLDAPDGHLFLKVRLAVRGDGTYVHRFSYQAHVKAVIAEPIITGTIRWATGIETHDRAAGLFTVTANLMQQDPAALSPTFDWVANGWVNVARRVGDRWEATYTILNPPMREDLYVICSLVPGGLAATGANDLIVAPGFAGPINLTGANPAASGVDFEVLGEAVH